jgi:putative glycosyltransferase (TIGR04372 family)
LGDLQEALRLLRFARRLRQRLFKAQEGSSRYRLLWAMWGLQIGHIANMEHLIKRELLLGRDPKNMVLYLPESLKPANESLLEKMGTYITIVRKEEELPFPEKVMLSNLEEYFLTESVDGLTKHWWHASPEIFAQWEKSGRSPLLTLSDLDIHKGRACLRELGIPDNAWFVCLHARESAFKQEQGYNAIEAVLNADIETYLPAIREVTKRGGWVIRVGDPKMRPLQSLPQTIDYARSSAKSDWMDVFLLGSCRFFIGTSSGPAYVPPLFGIPCVLTNWVPTGQRPFNSRDIYIPKLYQAGSPRRPLSFAQMMAPPIGYAPRYVHAEALGLITVPNTAEEICEVVSEMLDRLDCRLSYAQSDDALQAAFDAVAETNLCIGNARIGRNFIQRHQKLLLQ